MSKFQVSVVTDEEHENDSEQLLVRTIISGQRVRWQFKPKDGIVWYNAAFLDTNTGNLCRSRSHSMNIGIEDLQWIKT